MTEEHPDIKGVIYLSDPDEQEVKEELYLGVREQEGRLLSDEHVKRLPFLSTNDSLATEWQLRVKSFERLKSIITRSEVQSILDIGCGNGWLINRLSSSLVDCQFDGVDLNRTELEQADRLFGSEMRCFYYMDLLSEDFQPRRTYDIIIFNASIQYFGDLRGIIERVIPMLETKGSIIINDSPIYPTAQEAEKARSRSSSYYSQLGLPAMSAHYFHHLAQDLKELGFNKDRSFASFWKRFAFPLFIYTKS